MTVDEELSKAQKALLDAARGFNDVRHIERIRDEVYEAAAYYARCYHARMKARGVV